MLRRSNLQQGVTLVELVIGMVIVALLFAMGAPSFAGWIQSAQIRTAAEAVQNGLQLARAAAVQRNSSVMFQLVTTLDNSCALAVAGPNWVVSQTVGMANAAGACGATPVDPPAVPSTTDPYIIQKRPAAEGSVNAVLAGSHTAIVFNGLGRVSNLVNAAGVSVSPLGTSLNIDISNPSGGSCVALGGAMRCLRVSVSSNGQVRMCDPAVTFSTTNPQGC